MGICILMVIVLLLGGRDSSSSTLQGSSSSSSHNIPYADESFRRLQSGEDSEEMVNQCCKREPHFVTIGYGGDGTQLRVDVGTCRQTCNKTPPRPLKRDEFDKYLKKYPNIDPVQIFLALQSRLAPTNSSTTTSVDEEEDDLLLESPTISPTSPSTPSCIDTIATTCRPTSSRSERHFTLAGTFAEVQVIESCDCVHVREDICERISRPVRLHVDTPFETVVEMGECVGPCGSGGGDSTCRPVRNKTTSIEGPNGVECVQVIEECACTGGCFRVKEFFKVFDFSKVISPTDNSNNSSSTNTLSSGDESKDDDNLISRSQPPLPPPTSLGSEPLIKLIDIGRCEGSCLGRSGPGKQGQIHNSLGAGGGSVSATSKCLMWSPNGRCLSSLYGGHPACSPTKLHFHSYMDRKGKLHSIYSIISCGCH